MRNTGFKYFLDGVQDLEILDFRHGPTQESFKESAHLQSQLPSELLTAMIAHN